MIASRSRLLQTSFATLIVASLPMLVGCFESKHPLSPRPAQQKIDARLLGDWTLEQLDDDGQAQTSKLVVRNVHGQAYYVEWIAGAGEDERHRSTAHLSDVGGLTFANLLPLSESEQPSEKYTILRVDHDAASGKLKIQNLDGDFFKDKPFDSSDALRKIVADNLHNEKMYRGEPMFGTKAGK